MQTKYELERLKLENSELVTKLNASQKLLDKFYKSKNIHLKNPTNNEEEEEEDEKDDDDDESSKSFNKKNVNIYKNDYLDDENDDNDMKELMKHAKQKLKLKLYNAKKNAGFNSNNESKSNSSTASSSNNNNYNELKNQILISTTSSSSNSTQNSDNESLKENNNNNKKRLSEFIVYQQSTPAPQITNNIDLSKHKLYLIDNINKEKDALNVANELLSKFKQSLAKRKLHLETTKQELKTDEKYASKSTVEKNKIESKKIEIDREEIDLKQLLLNIRSTKRVLKQKKSQLNMLENNVTENNKVINNIKETSFSSDTDISQTQNEILSHSYFKSNNNSNYLALNELNKISDDSNLNELIIKLNKLHTNGELTDSTLRSLEPILQSLPKLNLKLKEKFQNLAKYNSKTNHTYDLNQTTDLEAASALSFINEKWQKYLSSSTELNKTTSTFDINQLFSKINSNNNNNNKQKLKDKKSATTTPNGTWENMPAYHKLTFEAGAKMLDDKWRKYIGDSSLTSTSRFLTPKKKNSKLSSSLIFGSNNELTVGANPLPVATQQRLNHHREWLKKFKAETTNFKF